MLNVLNGDRCVFADGGDEPDQFRGGRRQGLLGGGQELLANHAIVRVVVTVLVRAQEVDGQEQPARHGGQGRAC